MLSSLERQSPQLEITIQILKLIHKDNLQKVGSNNTFAKKKSCLGGRLQKGCPEQQFVTNLQICNEQTKKTSRQVLALGNLVVVTRLLKSEKSTTVSEGLNFLDKRSCQHLD